MNPDVQNYLLMYRTTQAYLRLSAAYADFLGGIRWSSEEDALSYPDGKIFTYFPPLAEFVEGFAAGGGRVVPFTCLLHWIDLLKEARGHLAPEVRRLRRTFREAGSAYRNAGALAAALSADLPEVADPPRLEDVCRRLRDRAFPIRWFTARFHESAAGPPETPPVAPGDFERRVVERLAAYSDEELRAWLTTGRGPVHAAGAALAHVPPPRSLAGVLAALLQRPRLAGAATYVTRLVGALTLPPRRLAPQELPVGGYADLATRGDLEQLLPSQHALDGLEFLRRFAEHEMLFFRREEPPAAQRQELVVLVDQGVRTWGDVRLVLAAAALALGKQAAARALPFALAGTSNSGRLLDPRESGAAALGELLEASDLSADPGAALEAVLERPARALRDVVLLTHPRNLREADVRAAARRTGARDRLFAVTLDEDGTAGVHEVRRGTPVPLRQFHVAFAASRAAAPAPAAGPGAGWPPWQGDVEPVPFPFRFGTCGKASHFAFDPAGRWLLTVSAEGMLHVWPLDADTVEVLPRPFLNGTLLRDIRHIIPVAAGFVLTGAHGARAFFAHYDVVRRTAAVRLLDCGLVSLTVTYVRELHCVVFADWKPGALKVLCAVDLTTGTTYLGTGPAGRVRQAWESVEQQAMRTLVVDTQASPPAGPPPPTLTDARGYRYFHHQPSGQLVVRGPAGPWGMAMPLADGRPLLRGAVLEQAQVARDVLAVKAWLQGGARKLLLCRAPDGALLREIEVRGAARFLLSDDGRWLAVERGGRIEVEQVDDPTVRVSVRAGGYSGEGRLYVDEQAMLVSLGMAKHWHLVRWSGDQVEFLYEYKKRNTDPFRTPAFRDVLARATPANRGTSPPLHYDDRRTNAVAERPDGRRFVLDRYGQVAVFDRAGRLLCMFMAFRNQRAAWLPDGRRCGSPALGLGPETPGARAALARVLSGEDQAV